MPGAAIPPLMDESSPVYQRAPVIGHTLWVTAHDDAERWPAGDYPTQSECADGRTAPAGHRPVDRRADAPLVDTDVVLWYVFGIHHITRVEDWPIMPVDTISFWLKPFGFFDANPSMDAPRTSGAGHRHHRPLPTRDRRTTTDYALRKARSCPTRRRSATSSTARADPARSGDVLDIVNPSTGEVYATSPNSKAEDIDAACQASGTAFEKWRWTTPAERQRALLKLADVIEENAEELVEHRVREHRQAARGDHERGDPADGRPDPLLRRRGAGPGGQVERGVHEGLHLLHPA